MLPDDVIIRECVSFDDFRQCVGLERSVFKDDDIDIMPMRLYRLSQACGAPTLGAFDPSGRLIGSVHTMVALRGRNVAYHSHLACVLEEHRHRDIGYRLKLAQRERAIEAGISLIIWTFDPLQSRNAHLNINKLGAVVRSYEIDYLGECFPTVFDSGVATDRLVAEWWIRSPHVEWVLSGNRPAADERAQAVTIPYDVSAERARSLEDHVRWRMQVRAAFLKAFGSGAIVRGFIRSEETRESRYLFGPDEEQFHFRAYASGD